MCLKTPPSAYPDCKLAHNCVNYFHQFGRFISYQSQTFYASLAHNNADLEATEYAIERAIEACAHY